MPTDADKKCPLCNGVGAILEERGGRTTVTCFNASCKLFGSKMSPDLWDSFPRQLTIAEVYVVQEKVGYGERGPKILGAWTTKPKAEKFYAYNESMHIIQRLALEDVKITATLPVEKNKEETISAVWGIFQPQPADAADYLVGIWADKQKAKEFCTNAGKGFFISRMEIQRGVTTLPVKGVASVGKMAPVEEPAGVDVSYDLLKRAEFHIEESSQWDQDTGEDFDSEERAMNAREELRAAMAMLIEHMKGK